MRFIALFLSLVLSVPVQATSLPFRKVDGTAFPGQAYRTNYLKNGEFDQSIKFGISDASSIATLAGSLFGANSLTITSTGSAQIVKVLGYQTDQKISGLNCQASFYYRNGANVKAYVLDSSTKVSADYTLATASGTTQRADIYFICDPSQHTYDLAFESTSSGSTLIVDSAYLGEALIGTNSVDTTFTDYGANTVTGTTSNPTKGTVVGGIDHFWGRRNGSNLEFRIEYSQTATGGAAGSGDYLWVIPTATKCTIDTTKMTAFTTVGGTPAVSNAVGFGELDNAGSWANVMESVYDSTHIRQYFVYPGPTVNMQGSGQFPFNATVRLQASGSVPCVGWTTLNAISPSQSASNWSGYHDNTCSWARTSASYGDPTADASCVLAQRAASNFGTPTTYNSAGSALPGVVFVPSGNLYWVCATPKIAGATLAATLDVRLWDGTTTIAEAQAQAFVANDIESLQLCGIYTASPGVSTTLSLQTKATSGAVTIAAGSTNASAVEWQIVNLTYGMQNPLLVNTVVNGTGASISTAFSFNYGGGTVTTACANGACTIYNNTGPGGISINNSSAVYVLTVPSGTCGATNLTCVVTATGGFLVSEPTAAPTATTYQWSTFNSSFSATNSAGAVHCECLK